MFKINREELATYTQKLHFIGEIYKNGLSLLSFEIANEMDCALNDADYTVDYTEEQFEKYCSVAEDAYLKAEETTVWAICRAVAEIVREDGEEKLLNMSQWDIIDKASYLL